MRQPESKGLERTSSRDRLLRCCALLSFVLVFPAAQAPASTASVDANGRIYKNGVPWFPIGMYHVSWIGDRQGAKAVADLEAIADAGFDLMHATVEASSGNRRRLEPILMFSPDYEFLDASGRLVAVPEDRIVPTEMAPAGMPLRTLAVPKNPYGATPAHD